MPCEKCPDEKPAAQNSPCERIPDPKLCALWKAMRELNEARNHFRAHMELIDCERCKKWAGFIIVLLDVYSRMTNAAENYKLERGRLIAQLDTLSKALEKGELGIPPEKGEAKS